jgi:hypothetical protein
MRIIFTAAILMAAVLLAGESPDGAQGAFISTMAGDADCDEQFTASDALTVAQHEAGLGDSFCLQLGNVICDDPLNMDDAIAILRIVAGLDVEQGDRCFIPGLTIPDDVVSQGTATVHGTFSFDFDTGSEAPNSGDFQWENDGTSPPDHDMFLTPTGGRVAPLSPDPPAYPVLNTVWLAALNFSQERIDGPGGADPGDLASGTAFAMLTDEGNYAKARILQVGYDLEIEWVTYSE